MKFHEILRLEVMGYDGISIYIYIYRYIIYIYIYHIYIYHIYIYIWLVVSIPLKNISQLGLLFPIYGKS